MIKKVIIYTFIVGIIISLGGVTFLYAFDWPQKPVLASDFFSEVRGSSFSSSVVFENPGEVASAEAGQVLMVLENNQSNMGWFDSPLGNTVILAHKNDMLSVYSNLVNIKVPVAKKEVALGEVIGVSGESGWKSGGTGVAFQVIDAKMKSLINPVVLMQESPIVRRSAIEGLVAVSRNGERFTLYNGASLTAGAYTLYMERPQAGMIHASRVTLNGEVKESVSYDTLSQVGPHLTVLGNKTYTYDEIYPQEDTMRLAEVPLSRGTNTIEISLSNVGGTESFARYRLSVN